MATTEESKRFWFAQVPNPKNKEPHWVRVSSSGRLNDSTYAVFKVRQAKEWREVEAASLSDARTALLGGKGKRLNAESYAAAKAAKAKKPAAKKTTAKKTTAKKTTAPAAAKTVVKEPAGGRAPLSLATSGSAE